MICRRLFLSAPFALVTSALVAGCASTAEPEALHLTILGGRDQNPDPAGDPTPVAIRLFLLSGAGRFDRANVFTLIAHERQTLGSDLLHSEEVVVSPGASLSLTPALPKGTRFLGAAVLFRDIDHAQWRATARLPSGGTTNLTLRIIGTKATLSR